MSESMRMPRKRFMSVGAIAVVLVVLGACGNAHRTARTLQSQSSQWGPERYTAQATYDRGRLTMDPDPTNAPTHMTQAQALAAASANPVFGSAIKGHTPEIRYGLFTNAVSGTQDASGKFAPLSSRVPAWMLIYRNVPWAGIGNGGPAATSATVPAVPEDLIIVVSDGTGSFLGAFSVEPG
jgi:hypothetical protein